MHFVAHSMGARTAIGLMRHNPDGFRSLTISGSNAGCVSEELRERKAELQASGALSGSLLQRALAEDFREREPALEWLYRRIRSINPPRPRDFLAPPPEMRNYRGSTRDRLLESGTPLLWIVGAQDRVVPAELVRISHEITPGSRYLEIADAGHSAYFERPDEWNAAVLGFIGEAEAIEAREWLNRKFGPRTMTTPSDAAERIGKPSARSQVATEGRRRNGGCARVQPSGPM